MRRYRSRGRHRDRDETESGGPGAHPRPICPPANDGTRSVPAQARLRRTPSASTPLDALLGEPAAVNDHGEGAGDDEDAGTPGKGDPDVGADRLLGEQVADRIDDGRHRLVLGEGPHRAWHGVGGHECRADERQEDERVGECDCAVRGLRGETGITAFHVNARVNRIRMPATASHASTPAPERKPIRRATSTTTTSDVRLATSDVPTCAHSTDDRGIGIDWKRSTMPLCMSLNSRNAV